MSAVPPVPPTNHASVEERITRVEERVDERFGSLSRQLNTMTDMVTNINSELMRHITTLSTHENNHHGKVSTVKQTGGTAALSGLLYLVIELVRRYWL